MIHEHKKEFAVFRGTVAEFTADTRKWHVGDILLPTDSNFMYIGKGTAIFTALKGIPLNGKATTVALTGANTPLTAIGATFADLAAANTAVTTLRSDAQTHIAALETKLDAVIGALKTAGVMA